MTMASSAWGELLLKQRERLTHGSWAPMTRAGPLPAPAALQVPQRRDTPKHRRYRPRFELQVQAVGKPSVEARAAATPTVPAGSSAASEAKWAAVPPKPAGNGNAHEATVEAERASSRSFRMDVRLHRRRLLRLLRRRFTHRLHTRAPERPVLCRSWAWLGQGSVGLPLRDYAAYAGGNKVHGAVVAAFEWWMRRCTAGGSCATELSAGVPYARAAYGEGTGRSRSGPASIRSVASRMPPPT